MTFTFKENPVSESQILKLQQLKYCILQYIKTSSVFSRYCQNVLFRSKDFIPYKSIREDHGLKLISNLPHPQAYS
jgi:hypothetical protein